MIISKENAPIVIAWWLLKSMEFDSITPLFKLKNKKQNMSKILCSRCCNSEVKDH